MAIQVKVHAGVDDAFIVWQTDLRVGCRGFALRRKVRRAAGSPPSPEALGPPDADGFVEEIVSTWVGFEGEPEAPAGTRKPSTEWPIQKYFWTDYAVAQGDSVAYRVAPVVRDAGGALIEVIAEASAWTPATQIGPDTGGGVSCYFNRGIVASQWLARLLPDDGTGKIRKLTKIIATPGDPTRNFLGGPQREKVTALLRDAARDGRHIYAALYELDDPELEGLLRALGKKAHIVLGNGSVKKKGADQNADARTALSPVCDVQDRMTSPRALAHNKFLVICDAAKRPVGVWTGSMNWTRTGLCTQANNSLYIENADLAAEYLAQWKRLAAAGPDTPDSLKAANAKPRTKTSAPETTLWFTPMVEQKDLEFCRERILAARQGVLFLMFNPGPMGTLLNVIIERVSPASSAYDPDLYIQGVLNQDPSTKTTKVDLFSRNERISAHADRTTEPNADLTLPAAIDRRLRFWVPELLKLPSAFAMVHSKTIVIDPFGDHPVVITGSHNLGPKASGVNDENMLVIEGNQRLAGAYASNIMAIYGQYRWRWRQGHLPPGGAGWQGLVDRDTWQINGARQPLADYDKRRLRELDFWFGRR